MIRIKQSFKYILLILLAVFLLYSALIEPNQLVIHQEILTIPHWPKKLDGLRVGVISDLHPGSPFINLAKMRLIVNDMNGLHPDLILLPGDFIEHVIGGRRITPEVTAALLKNLHAAYGTFAVLGNHDWYYNGIRVWTALESQGIPVLDNRSVKIKLRGVTLWIAGTADLWTSFPDVHAALAGIPARAPILLVTHNPAVFRRVPERVSLTIAGHTHGGQVKFPLIGAPFLWIRGLREYASGEIVRGDRHLFVTTGVGTSILPLRFRVPPEIVLLTLKSQH